MWGSAVQVCSGLPYGGLAQLARAPALQAGGQRFESVILHLRLYAMSFVIYDLSFSVCAAFFDILEAKAKCKANLHAVVIYNME